MLVAALTGGIATGKSTVARLLAAAGAGIVDADQLAREAVAPHTPAWEKIVAHFGRSVLLPDETLDRPALASMVFGHPDQNKVLDAIVHPEVFTLMGRRVAEQIRLASAETLIIIDVPLLVETGMEKQFAEVILVYAPRHIQLARLMARDGIDRQAALDRIGSQLDIEAKTTRATIVIDNSGTSEQLAEAVRGVHDRLSALARSNPTSQPLAFSSSPALWYEQTR